MANSNQGYGDLLYCDLCKQWMMDGYNENKPFKMSYAKYMIWYIEGWIDANSNFDSVENCKEMYEKKYGKWEFRNLVDGEISPFYKKEL